MEDYVDAMVAVTENGLRLKNFPKYNNDRNIVSRALVQNSHALQYASDELRDNEHIVMLCAHDNGYDVDDNSDRNVHPFEYASARVRVIPWVAELFMFYNHKILGMFCDISKLDKKFILSLVSESGSVLETLSDEMRDDYDIVYCAIKQYSYAIEFASARLKCDKELVILSAKQQSRNLLYADISIRDDVDIVLAMMESGRYGLEYSGSIITHNPKIILVMMCSIFDNKTFYRPPDDIYKLISMHGARGYGNLDVMVCLRLA